MRVKTVTREHPASVIATEQRQPMQAAPLAAIPHSDKMQGMLLAQETMALVQTHAHSWHGMATRLIRSTTEARASFLVAVRDAIKTLKAENNEANTMDAKASGRRVQSALTNVGYLTAIAKGFNEGGNIRGLVDWYNQTAKVRCSVDEWERIGWTLMRDYARTFNKTSGRGRTPDNLLVKFGKWLDNQRAEYEGAEADVLKDLSRLYEQEQKKHPDLLPAAAD